VTAPVGFLLYDPYTRPLSAAGRPQAGAYYQFYLANTTTPTDVYSNAQLTSSLGSTVTSDSSGTFPLIYMNPTVEYRVQLYSQAGALIEDTLYFLPPQQPTVVWGGTDTGTVNAYAVTVASSFSTVPDGLTVIFIPSNTNTGPSTLAVNGGTPIDIDSAPGDPIGAGALVAGQPAEVVYSAGAGVFYLLSSGGGGGGGGFGLETVIASASTVDLGTAPGHTVYVSGSATIGSFGSSANVNSPIYLVRFGGAPILADSGALALPTGADIDVLPGDWAVAQYLGSGNWVLVSYNVAAGGALGTPRASGTIASASTTDLGTIQSQVVEITGTTTIGSFGASANPNTPIYFVTFDSALTITYNATSMILPGATNLTTAAGDTAVVQYLGSGNWKVVQYTVAANSPQGGGGGGSSFQTGSVSTTSNAGNVNVSFSPSFPTAADFVGVTVIAPSGVGAGWQSFLNSKSAAGFQWRTVSESNVAITINWYAIGH
jgi:hypothetical protein